MEMETTARIIQNKLVAEVAAILDSETADIDPARSLAEIGMDSVSLLELFIVVEKEFGVSLLTESVEGEPLTSLAAIARRVNQLCGKE